MITHFQLPKVSGPLSLTDKAYELLKDAILSHELQPGIVSTEVDLANQLGISKTPIREAIDRLVQDGLVVKVPYKGIHIAEISIDDVKELLKVRTALEGLAARLATFNFQENDILHARNLLSMSEGALFEDKYDLCSNYGREFHHLIIRKANNRYLISLWKNLDTHFQRYRNLAGLIPGRLSISVQEHKSVLNALQQKDPNLAEQALENHLHTFITAFLAHVESTKGKELELNANK